MYEDAAESVASQQGIRGKINYDAIYVQNGVI